jgi:hypothetical protein
MSNSELLAESCKCFGESGFHVSTFTDGDGAERCDICGKLVTLAKKVNDSAAPAAWSFELARARTWEDGRPVGWDDWGPTQLSHLKPHVPEGSIRNLEPLYARTQLDELRAGNERLKEALILTSGHLVQLGEDVTYVRKALGGTNAP